MKTFRTALIATSLLLPIVTLASQGDSTLLWSSFTATPSTGVAITWTDRISYVFADSPVASSAAFAGAPDWTSLRTVSESSGDATGAAEADADRLFSRSEGTTSSALGQAWREGIFTMSGPGTVTFEVDYTVSVLGTAGNNFNFTTAAASLLLDSNAPRVDAILDSINGDAAQSGRLQLLVTNSSAGPVSWKLIGGATTVTTVTTAVPEPATGALVMGALGLMGWARRRQSSRDSPRVA